MLFMSIYSSRETGKPPSAEEIARMGKLIEEETRKGVLISTGGCLPSALGARVRMANGEVTTVDGPFTETKEVIGGFAILECPSKAEAIEAAKRFMRVVGGDGECEVRQMAMAGDCK